MVGLGGGGGERSGGLRMGRGRAHGSGGVPMGPGVHHWGGGGWHGPGGSPLDSVSTSSSMYCPRTSSLMVLAKFVV